MPIYVSAYDGTRVGFADGTPQHVIDMVMARDFKAPPAPPPIEQPKPEPKANDFDPGQWARQLANFPAGALSAKAGILGAMQLHGMNIPDQESTDLDNSDYNNLGGASAHIGDFSNLFGNGAGNIKAAREAANANMALVPKNSTPIQGFVGGAAQGLGAMASMPMAGIAAAPIGFGGQQIDQKLQEAQAAGITDPNKLRAIADQSGLLGAGTGIAFEALGPLAGRLGKGIADPVLGQLAEAGMHVGGTGALMGGQQFGGNLISQQNINPQQNLFEGVPQAIGAGMVMGGIGHLIGGSERKRAEIEKLKQPAPVDADGQPVPQPGVPASPEAPEPGHPEGGAAPDIIAPAHPDPDHPSNLPGWNNLEPEEQAGLLNDYEANKAGQQAPQAPQEPAQPAPQAPAPQTPEPAPLPPGTPPVPDASLLTPVPGEPQGPVSNPAPEAPAGEQTPQGNAAPQPGQASPGYVSPEAGLPPSPPPEAATPEAPRQQAYSPAEVQNIGGYWTVIHDRPGGEVVTQEDEAGRKFKSEAEAQAYAQRQNGVSDLIPKPERAVPLAAPRPEPAAPLPPKPEIKPPPPVEAAPKPIAKPDPYGLAPEDILPSAPEPEAAKPQPGMPDNSPAPPTPSYPQSQLDAFGKLANAQRDKPERAMVQAQQDLAGYPAGSTLGYIMEHVGDLTHRMAQRHAEKMNWGKEYVEPKVRSALAVLQNGLDRIRMEQIPQIPSMERYADEHAKLPVYNRAQELARDAAVAIGKKDFYPAERHLAELKKMLDTPGAYEAEASKYNPNYEADKRSPKPTPTPPAAEKMPTSLQKLERTVGVGANKRTIEYNDPIDKAAHIVSRDPENNMNNDNILYKWLKSKALTDGQILDHGNAVANQVSQEIYRTPPGQRVEVGEVEKSWEPKAAKEPEVVEPGDEQYDNHPAVKAIDDAHGVRSDALQNVESRRELRRMAKELAKNGHIDEDGIEEMNDALNDDKSEQGLDEAIGALHENLDSLHENARDELIEKIKNGEYEAPIAAAPEPEAPHPGLTRLAEPPHTYAALEWRNSAIHADAKNFEDAIAGKKPSEVADIIAQRNPNRAINLIAKRVAAVLRSVEAGANDIDVRIVKPGDTIPKSLTDPSVAGMFYREKKGADDSSAHGTVFLKSTDVGEGGHGMLDEVVLHELIHAATSNMMDMGILKSFENTEVGKAVNSLLGVFNHVVERYNSTYKDKAGIDGIISKGNGGAPDFEHYISKGSNSLQNLKEMVAWALTDKGFQDYLESIPRPGGNLFSDFVNAVRRMLGLPLESGSALSEVLRASEKIFDAAENNPKENTVARGFTAAKRLKISPLEDHASMGMVGGHLVDKVNIPEANADAGMAEALDPDHGANTPDYAGVNGAGKGASPRIGVMSNMIMLRSAMAQWMVRDGMVARAGKLISAKTGINADTLLALREKGTMLGYDKNAPLALLMRDVLQGGKTLINDANNALFASDLTPHFVQSRSEAFRKGAWTNLTDKLNALTGFSTDTLNALERSLKDNGFDRNFVSNAKGLDKNIPTQQTLTEAYAYAMHAQERNEFGLRVKKKIIGKDDQGNPIYDPSTSGMTNEEAKHILNFVDNLPENTKNAIRDAHDHLMNITKQSTEEQIRDGLIPNWDQVRKDMADNIVALKNKLDAEPDKFKRSTIQRQIDAVSKKLNAIPDYKNYIPLQSDVDALPKDLWGNPVDMNAWGSFSGGEAGMGVKGKESQDATGRTSYAGQIIPHTAENYYSGMSRGIRNVAAQKLMNLIADGYKTNDDFITSKFGKVGNIPVRPFIKDDGSIGYNVADYRNQPNSFIAKFNGREQYVQIKDPSMMAMINSMDGTNGKFFKSIKSLDNWMATNWAIHAWGRTFHLINAGMSVPFASHLLIKHTAVAALNGSGVAEGLGLKGGELAAKISAETYNVGKGFLSNDPQVRQDLATLRKYGGLYMPADPFAVGNVEAELGNLLGGKEWANASIGNRYKSYMSQVHKVEKAVTSFTNHVEWTTRVAVFRAMRDSGMAENQAAWYAQELTGNFGRKGMATRTLAALYPFYNAGVQSDAASMASLMQGGMKHFVKSVGGLAALGTIIGMYNYWMGDMNKDEYGNNPYSLTPWKKKASTFATWTIPTTSYYIKAPMPFKLFSMPITAGVGVVSMLHGDVKPFELATSMLSDTISANAHWSSSPTADPTIEALPTVLRPIFELNANKNDFGSTIWPGLPTPDKAYKSQIYTRNASGFSIGLADLLHKSGLGEVYPDAVDFMGSSAFGSAGAYLYNTANFAGTALNKDEQNKRIVNKQEPYDFFTDNPIGKLFLGKMGPADVSNKFYNDTSDMRKYLMDKSIATKSGDPQELMRLQTTDPKASFWARQYEGVENEVSGANRAIRELQQDKEMPTEAKVNAIASYQKQIDGIKRQFLYQYHNQNQYPTSN